MKCPYCAEEIQNEAILCRFCGARKLGAVWQAPAPPPLRLPAGAPPAGRKINYTIRTAAVFFFLSALMEEMALTSKIPMFGAVRGGTVAVSYHLLYIGLYVAMGIGLWVARPWGYNMMVGGTIFYTLDRLRYLLDFHARAAELKLQMEDLGDLIDVSSFGRIYILTAIFSLACWWLFLFYLYRRRSEFVKQDFTRPGEGLRSAPPELNSISMKDMKK